MARISVTALLTFAALLALLVPPAECGSSFDFNGGILTGSFARLNKQKKAHDEGKCTDEELRKHAKKKRKQYMDSLKKIGIGIGWNEEAWGSDDQDKDGNPAAKQGEDTTNDKGQSDEAAEAEEPTAYPAGFSKAEKEFLDGLTEKKREWIMVQLDNIANKHDASAGLRRQWPCSSSRFD